MKRDCDVVFYNKDKAKRDELLKLDVQEIKNYIHYLTKQYYFTYAMNDIDEFKNVCNSIDEINRYLHDVYPNIYHYILYCFFVSSNIFLKASFDRDVHLLKPQEIDFEYEKDNEFLYSKHDMTREEMIEWLTITDEDIQKEREFRDKIGLY